MFLIYFLIKINLFPTYIAYSMVFQPFKPLYVHYQREVESRLDWIVILLVM